MKLLINNKDIAKLVWLKFYQKYSTLVQTKNSASTIVCNTSSPQKPAFKLKTSKKLTQEEAVILMQRKWRELLYGNVKIPVNTRRQRPHTLFFVGNESIKKSLNKQQLLQLHQAIIEGDWSKIDISNESIPQVAFQLFHSKKINDQQFYSIIERIQVQHDYKIKHTYPMLDQNGEFTTEAKSMFLPRFRINTEPDNLEGFRLMIAELPQSEQVFYTSELGSLTKIIHTQLGYAVISLSALLIDLSNQQMVHMSFGVKDAFYLVLYGIEDYVRPTPRLSKLTPIDIEMGVRLDIRFKSSEYPGAQEPYDKKKGIHNTPATPLVSGAHDIAHAHAMCSIPEKMRKALHRFIDVARNSINIPENAEHNKISKEIWTWIDCTYQYFLLNPEEKKKLNAEDKKSYTKAFCDLLLFKNNDSEDVSYLITNQRLTAMGAAILLDMHLNKQDWLEFNIEPDCLTDRFKEQYDLIGHFLKNDPFKTLLNTFNTEMRVFAIQCMSLLLPHDIYINEIFFQFEPAFLKNAEKFLQFFKTYYEQVNPHFIKIDKANENISNARVNMMHPMLFDHVINEAFLELICIAANRPDPITIIRENLKNPLFNLFCNNNSAMKLARCVNIPLFELLSSHTISFLNELNDISKIPIEHINELFDGMTSLISSHLMTFEEAKTLKKADIIYLGLYGDSFNSLILNTHLTAKDILKLSQECKKLLCTHDEIVIKLMRKGRITKEMLFSSNTDELTRIITTAQNKQIIYANPNKNLFVNNDKFIDDAPDINSCNFSLGYMKKNYQ